MRKIDYNRNFENINKRRFQGIGKYDIPVIEPEYYEECKFIGFNYAARSKKNRQNLGIHFYLDDYQFIRIWNNIDYYLPMLKDFKYILSPDFSTYSDFPLALQLYNHYRKHWLGAYLQEQGIKVIPTISWGDSKSYEWCFLGEPVRGTVSVSAIGTQMNKLSKQAFLEGYKEMIKRLNPITILFYGPVPKECCGENIVKITAFQEERWGMASDGR